MKQDISTWITALRSGDYEQTRNSLYDKDSHSFCCLGVYAKVNGLAKFGQIVTDYENIYEQIYKTIDYNFAWKLIRLNDNLPSSNFNQIADVIEKEYSK